MIEIDFLREELNRVMSDYRNLTEAQRNKPNKKADEIECRRASLSRMQAGWGALCAWVELSTNDIASAPEAKSLLDAGLGLMAEGPQRERALLAVGLMALRRDNPDAWCALRDNGFDATKALLESRGRFQQLNWWSRMDEPQLGWLALAVDQKRWKMAEMLMSQPEGACLVPTKAGEAPEMAELKDISERDKEDEWAFERNQMGLCVALRWQKTHPLLVLWANEESDHDKKILGSRPAKDFEKRLVAAGFGLVWESLGFEAAAVDMALRGHAPAIKACTKHGARPSAASAFGLGDTTCALEGGVLKSSKSEEKIWGQIKNWVNAIDPEFSNKAELTAAQDALVGMARRNWSLSGTDASVATQCVARLVAGAGSCPAKDAESATEWTQWCVELADLSTRHGANAQGREVLRVLESGLQALDMAKARSQGRAAPVKRILKA